MNLCGLREGRIANCLLGVCYRVSVSQEEIDCAHMRVALREAGKAVGLTSPNPPVGCVVVKGGKILARGYHGCAGGPHAEIEAMQRLKARVLRGSTIYVTLEPCSSMGKTPPCVTAIRQAGIARVVYGIPRIRARPEGFCVATGSRSRAGYWLPGVMQ